MKKQATMSNFVQSSTSAKVPRPASSQNQPQVNLNPAVRQSSTRVLPSSITGSGNTGNAATFLSNNRSSSNSTYSITARKEKTVPARPNIESEDGSTIDLQRAYKLSHSQKKVLDAIMKRKSVFFTGAAGTGKSYVVQILRSVIEALQWEDKIAYTAPTGVAACNIRGLTIHSWSGIGKASEPIEQLIGMVMRNTNACKRWRETEILVIDEISMLSSEVFDKLDIIGRRVRNNINPFGGLQLILCGDFFQLPPVGLGSKVKFCFEAQAWKEIFLGENRASNSNGMIILDKVFRQKDDTTFLNLLNELREGVISQQSQEILLRKVREAQLQPDDDDAVGGGEERADSSIPRISSTVNSKPTPGAMASTFRTAAAVLSSQPSQSSPATTAVTSINNTQAPNSQQSAPKIRPTKLFSTNQDVDSYNLSELERLVARQDPAEAEGNNSNNSSDPIVYFAVDEGKDPYLTQLKNGMKAPEKLYLKRGAQVMLLKNLDTEAGLVNGARGTVIGFEKAAGRTNFCARIPVVNFIVLMGGERLEVRRALLPESWEIKLGESVVARRVQIPLILAWAISIHKSQGMTIPLLEVSFNRMFEFGQAYVALSRATSLQGLTLRSFQPNAVRAHPTVKTFYQALYEQQRQQKQEQHANGGNDEDVVSVTLQTFLSAFQMDVDLRQVDPDDWIEARPPPTASSLGSTIPNTTITNNPYKNSRPLTTSTQSKPSMLFNQSPQPSSTSIPGNAGAPAAYNNNAAYRQQQQHQQQQQERQQRLQNVSSKSTASETVVDMEDDWEGIPTSSSPTISDPFASKTPSLQSHSHQNHGAVTQKRPQSNLANGPRAASRSAGNLSSSNDGFQSARSDNTFGDTWLDEAFLQEKRQALEKKLQAQALALEMHQQQLQQQQQEQSTAHSSPNDNKKAAIACDVVDLVDSDEEVDSAADKAAHNSLAARITGNKTESAIASSSGFAATLASEVDSGGYGAQPYRVNTGSAPVRQAMATVSDSLKRKMEDNRKAALEKLAIFKRSRLQYPTDGSSSANT